jgi:hypothetical protein
MGTRERGKFSIHAYCVIVFSCTPLSCRRIVEATVGQDEARGFFSNFGGGSSQDPQFGVPLVL